MSRSYLNEKLEARFIKNKGGFGVFANTHIKKDELLCAWGGNIWTREQFAQLPDENQSHGIQIDEELFQTYTVYETPDSADYVNHSCEPNAGLRGPITLIAIRDISPNEEICFDYAMSDSDPYDEFTCECGTALCRGNVTGNDWQLEELHQRYALYFSPYLKRRIEKLTKEATTTI
jgi:SET domain-containing protein